ncbi:39S ribosomal protein L46, mitochondrial [Patella vulgata]|uniref:39S ribosomal protein L46, mitochondrial n=1 Tax=Patella vulgata TaxID=6465 RepID=UPI0024A8AADF|nr:39S ribosomal protein L46, mitochondrial [Patella vulgata]
MATSMNMLKSLLLLHGQTVRFISKAQCRDVVRRQCGRRCSSTNVMQATGDRYDLLGAVCLERKPIIVQKKTQIEEKYNTMIRRIENEHSLLSDHELRHKEDLLYAEKSKEDDFEETEIDGTRQTALDREDIWESEAKAFITADTITEADKTDDRRSLERKLDEKLILIVKQKLGNTEKWILPQSSWVSGESMRETATRALKSSCGEVIESVFYGNAPCGFYKYNYPKTVNKETRGSKIFFFKAKYKEGEVTINKDNVIDYLWVTKTELIDYLNRDYYRSVDQFILDL